MEKYGYDFTEEDIAEALNIAKCAGKGDQSTEDYIVHGLKDIVKSKKIGGKDAPTQNKS